MIFFIKKLRSTWDPTFIFFLGNETQQTRDGEYLKHLPFKHFFPCDALNGLNELPNSLRMHFCLCDSGMSLILEVDVAAAAETTISILLFRDAKQPIAFTVWLLNVRWRCVDTSWID